MSDDARFEIWFPSPEEVSVFIETPATDQAREIVEIGLFAAFAARQIANLKRDYGTQAMCMALAEMEHPTSDEDIPDTIGDTRLVPPSPSQGRKGFIGTVTNKNGLPLINLKPRGFGMMGRGVAFYAPTATMALLRHLLQRQSADGRIVLVETARNIGRMGLAGQIGVTSSHKMAGAAVSAALQSLQDAEPIINSERADDPEDDYALLAGKTSAMLSQVVEDITGGSDNRAIVPDWASWRTCREMVVLHYQLFDDELLSARGNEEGSGEYDTHLERVIEEHGLSSVVERLHTDFFSTE